MHRKVFKHLAYQQNQTFPPVNIEKEYYNKNKNVNKSEYIKTEVKS